MKVVVKSVLAVTELEAAPKSLFREIFQTISKSLGLHETWYFGLCYQANFDSDFIWVDTSKKALKDVPFATERLYFRIKYYPEDISTELIENITIKMFFTEIKAAILDSNIYCPADTAALLASYSLQVKYGDFNELEHTTDFMSEQSLLPERVIKQHDLDVYTWTESITNMWKNLNGIETEEAMLEYLKLVQNLSMYGVTYYKIKNKKGTELLLGITALGLDIYKVDDQLNAQISFPWSEIKHLTFRDTKFLIKPIDKKAPDFVFFTSSGKCSKQILNLGVGNHDLYVKRRRPERPEVTRMREKANALRELSQKHKNKLLVERSAKEEYRQRELEYQKKLKQLRNELEQSRRHLLEANQIIQQLQDQLFEVQQAKTELEIEQRKLKSMMERLQDAKNMEETEKLKLEKEIIEKQELVRKIKDEVAEKDEETKRLKDQVEEARRREEQLIIERQEAEEAEREKKRIEEEEEESKKMEDALPKTSQVSHVLQEQLEVLQNKLSESFKLEDETELDKIHRINVLEGRDKFKTLADIRRGNTTRRIEMFENM